VIGRDKGWNYMDIAEKVSSQLLSMGINVEIMSIFHSLIKQEGEIVWAITLVEDLCRGDKEGHSS